MPIDANETMEWSATSLILLPNTQLPELFRLLASLQELRAGDLFNISPLQYSCRNHTRARKAKVSVFVFE